MEVNQTGFKKYVRKGVPLNLNEVLTVDIPLQIGAPTETVEVTGRAAGDRYDFDAAWRGL